MAGENDDNATATCSALLPLAGFKVGVYVAFDLQVLRYKPSRWWFVSSVSLGIAALPLSLFVAEHMLTVMRCKLHMREAGIPTMLLQGSRHLR